MRRNLPAIALLALTLSANQTMSQTDAGDMMGTTGTPNGIQRLPAGSDTTGWQNAMTTSDGDILVWNTYEPVPGVLDSRGAGSSGAGTIVWNDGTTSTVGENGGVTFDNVQELGGYAGQAANVLTRLPDSLQAIGQADGVVNKATAAAGVGCALSHAGGAAAAAAGVASGIFSGGRATLGMQVAQQAQLVFQSACAVQALTTQLQMITGYGQLRSVDDLMRALSMVESVLGTVQRVTYNTALAEQQFVETFRNTTGLSALPPELATPAIGDRYLAMRESAADALQESTKVRAMAVQSQSLARQRVASGLRASTAAQGQTQAIQAGNALVAQVAGLVADGQAEMVAYHEAHLRAMQDDRMGIVLAKLQHEKNLAGMGEQQTTGDYNAFERR